MKKGDIIQLCTINKQGLISFQRLKVKDARLAKRQLAEKGYYQIQANQYLCNRQYD